MDLRHRWRTRRPGAASWNPADRLGLWAVSRGASHLVIDLGPYEACRVAGIVQKLRLDPLAGVVEVLVADGTATTSAVWSLRRGAPQLALVPGRAVILSGVTRPGDDGRLVLHEPAFELVSLCAEAAA